MPVHYAFGPSAAARILACTPSLLLTAGLPSTTNAYAEEGTDCHTLGEYLIRERYDMSPDPVARLEVVKGRYYGRDMQRYAEGYRDYVTDIYEEAKPHTPDALLELEVGVDYTEYVREGMGTSDATVVADRVLNVIDLKYGRVEVDAYENPQVMLYGLGALLKYNMSYDIELVRMHIYQPRLNNYSVFEIAADELLLWAETVLKPAAVEAWNGSGRLVTGKHCKYCKIYARCPAQLQDALELAKMDFVKPEFLQVHEIETALRLSETVPKWLEAVTLHALHEALKGVDFPNYKVVQGRSVRRIVEEEFLIDELTGLGIDRDELFNTKIKGIGDLEVILGRRKGVLEFYTDKPPGKPKLVPITAKGERYTPANAAADDFTDELTEEYEDYAF